LKPAADISARRAEAPVDDQAEAVRNRQRRSGRNEQREGGPGNLPGIAEAKRQTIDRLPIFLTAALSSSCFGIEGR
jgi:hypothetical protein